MKQEVTNHPENRMSNISFHQKSIGLSLVITSSAAMYYLANMLSMRETALASGILPVGYGSLVLTTIILFILAQIVLQIVLAFGSGSVPTATPHEKEAELKATRNAYGVLTFAMFVTIGSVVVEGLTPLTSANLAILGFTTAEIVRFTSQLIYARR